MYNHSVNKVCLNFLVTNNVQRPNKYTISYKANYVVN